MNIAVEFGPALFRPSSLACFHNSNIFFTFGLVQSRFPAIQLSYSAGGRIAEPRPDIQNSMPYPSLFPNEKHGTFTAFLIAPHAVTHASHVAGGFSASKPACR